LSGKCRLFSSRTVHNRTFRAILVIVPFHAKGDHLAALTQPIIGCFYLKLSIAYGAGKHNDILLSIIILFLPTTRYDLYHVYDTFGVYAFGEYSGVERLELGARSRVLGVVTYALVSRPFREVKEPQPDGAQRSVVLMLFSKKTSARCLASSRLLLVWTFDAKWWPNL